MKKWLSWFLISCLIFCFVTPTFANDLPQRGVWVPLPAHVTFENKTITIALKWVDYSDLIETFNQFRQLSYDKVVIDLFSFGGSVFDALAMVALFEDLEREGKIVEIHAKGIVASAGVIIMMCGTNGHRFIDRNAFVMFHEIQSFKFMSFESVSDQEEQAVINRKIQDKINSYITQKTKITSQQLSDRIKKHEMWADADESVKLGFADKVTGK